ncbi:hypothetical protein [Stenotrophomonas sp.]|uniref:hypothetical protein n=1 Tax=Stenotrophomonas sp. TaxID=69392 RepID=UPI0028A8E97B|nr:hypothetical protein [Stenotrophomonas sp.]
MRRAHWLGIGAVLLLAGAALLAWQRWAPQGRPPSVAFPAPVPALQADIERHLREDRAFRDDVVFLLAATVRDRCVPAEAGVLARMANRAALPVLGAVSAVTAQDRRLDRPIYQFIQHRADSTECGAPLHLPASGAVPLQVDVEQYARSFPDSYYDPARSSVPRDFGGRSLVERAGNACNSVVYSVLPLGPGDWRCSMLWANARSRVRGACESELQRQHGSTGGELDMAVGQGMQGAVVAAIAALPEGCR